MDRPKLDKGISIDDFNDFYWLKQELVDFCKTVGMSTSGGKMEIADRIRHYIRTREALPSKPPKARHQSTFNWDSEILTKDTIITGNYKNGENVRNFFIQEIGTHFSFNVIFMKWMRENAGKKLEDAIAEWNRIDKMKKDKNYVSEIDPQFEYNRYMRAFLNDNPHLSSREAMKFWNLKRAKRGTNEYERSDLDLK